MANARSRKPKTPRTVLITGASTGIGRALALEYAARGASVALAARREDLLRELATTIAERHGERTGDGRPRAVVLPVDVRDPDAVAAMVRRAESELGSLDMVIANAGIGATGHASTLRWDQIADVLDINVRGAFATLLAAVPIMLHQQHGHLVGISSLAGRRGLPTSGAYSASKAALTTFLETLRIDLAPAGIKVTDVQPGFVDTPMTQKNAFPMPFMWPVEKAARVVADRLERAPATLAFPWQLASLLGVAKQMPAFVYDRFVRMFSPAR
jgi:NAD(P)-dependent dehydrogenase (short-subunit alcohol dehydrogenase family)